MIMVGELLTRHGIGSYLHVGVKLANLRSLQFVDLPIHYSVGPSYFNATSREPRIYVFELYNNSRADLVSSISVHSIFEVSLPLVTTSKPRKTRSPPLTKAIVIRPPLRSNIKHQAYSTSDFSFPFAPGSGVEDIMYSTLLIS